MVDDRVRIIGGPDFDGYAYAVARSVYAMVHEPVLDRLGEIRVPALVIFGEDDGLIPNPILHGGTHARRRRGGDAAFAARAAGDDSARRPHGAVRAAQPSSTAALLELLSKEDRHETRPRCFLVASRSPPLCCPSGERAPGRHRSLTQVTSFGSNPGGLRMWKYVPSGMPPNAPLVLALHACSQQAADYVKAGWNELADKYKFYVVYPEQTTHE